MHLRKRNEPEAPLKGFTLRQHSRFVCLRPAPLRDEAGDAEEVFLAALEGNADAREV